MLVKKIDILPDQTVNHTVSKILTPVRNPYSEATSQNVLIFALWEETERIGKACWQILLRPLKPLKVDNRANAMAMMHQVESLIDIL